MIIRSYLDGIHFPLLDSFDKQFHQRIGHRNQIIVLFSMQPGIDDFIHGTDNKAFDQPDIKIFANGAFLLTLLAGLGPAWAVSRFSFPGRRALLGVLTAVFVLPTVVVGAAIGPVVLPTNRSG